MFILKNSYPKGLVMISNHMTDKNIFLKSFVAKKNLQTISLSSCTETNKQKSLVWQKKESRLNIGTTKQ